MLISEHLDQLREHAVALGDHAEQLGSQIAVPSCPGWTVHDLVGHLGSTHRWASACLTAAPGSERIAVPPAPEDGRLLWYREGARQLIDTLANAPDDLQVWAFLPAPSPKAFWARRQAQETAMHRADIEQAAGTPITFAPEFAIDGIDELLNGFLARPRSALLADPPTSLLIEATDSDSWWHVTIGQRGRVTRTTGDRRADATVRGSASDLYLFLWNRVPAAPVEQSGDASVALLWREKATV